MSKAINSGLKPGAKQIQVCFNDVVLGGDDFSGWAPDGAYELNILGCEVVEKKKGKTGNNLKIQFETSDNAAHKKFAGVPLTAWHPMQVTDDPKGEKNFNIPKFIASYLSAKGADVPTGGVKNIDVSKLVGGKCYALLKTGDKGSSEIAVYLSKEGFERQPGPRDPDQKRPEQKSSRGEAAPPEEVEGLGDTDGEDFDDLTGAVGNGKGNSAAAPQADDDLPL